MGEQQGIKWGTSSFMTTGTALDAVVYGTGGKTGFLVPHLLPVNSVMVSILSLFHVPSSIRSSVSSLGELALTWDLLIWDISLRFAFLTIQNKQQIRFSYGEELHHHCSKTDFVNKTFQSSLKSQFILVWWKGQEFAFSQSLIPTILITSNVTLNAKLMTIQTSSFSSTLLQKQP